MWSGLHFRVWRLTWRVETISSNRRHLVKKHKTKFSSTFKKDKTLIEIPSYLNVFDVDILHFNKFLMHRFIWDFCTLCSVTIFILKMKSVSQKNELRVFWREAVQMELFSLTFAIFTFFHVVRDFKMVRNYFNLLLNYRSMCFQWECRFDFDVMCAEFLVQANTPHQLMWISSYMPNATRDHKSDCRLAYMRAEKIRCRVMCTQTGTARAMLNMCKPIYHYCDLSFRSKFVI